MVAVPEIYLVPAPTVLEPGDGVYPFSGEEEIRTSIGEGFLPEGYRLDVDETGVSLQAGDEAGLFYGLQTVRQLLPPGSAAGDIPFVHIEDAPRFAWRGAMFDVARHFFSVEDLERQLDLMAAHKLNRLHLHLTDDQGWRIEIQSWPDLTAIGGATAVGGAEGGFYTQVEYARLVEYAAERHIVVVPEIDFPGHSNAALASYPELNESGVAAEPFTGTTMHSASLWLDGEVTWEFVTDVWTEMAAITPGPYLHVGADEAINTAEEDYAVFVPWLQDLVAAQGKTMVGWDEIGTVALRSPAVAQQWQDADRARAAAAQGAQVLASPGEHAYLDMVYDADAEYGQIWAGAVNVEAAYDWDPVPEGLAESDVIGVEGALWTEHIDTVEKLDFMVWPRLACLAEVAWSPADRSWEEFMPRLSWHGARLDAAGVGYYRSPEMEWP